MINAGSRFRRWQPTNIQMRRKASKMHAAGYWADIGDWQKARESFEKAHQLDPKSAEPLIALGQVSAQMKDVVSARKYYEEALKVEPNGQYAQAAKEALQKLKKK